MTMNTLSALPSPRIISHSRPVSNASTPRSINNGQQYSKIAMDNGDYQYIFYNTNDSNHYQSNYDYYCHQYIMKSHKNLSSSYSTNCTYSRNNEIITNPLFVSKVAKEPYGPSSKVAIPCNYLYTSSSISSHFT